MDNCRFNKIKFLHETSTIADFLEHSNSIKNQSQLEHWDKEMHSYVEHFRIQHLRQRL